MKKHVRAMVGALVLGIASLAFGQADYPPANPPSSMSDEMTVTGSVVSTTSTAIVIRTDTGENMTFIRDSSSLLPADLKAGNRVTVGYHELANGDLHAANVSLVSASSSSNPGSAGLRTDQPQVTAPRSSSSTSMPSTSMPSTTTPAGDDPTMPHTASPLVLTGLSGLAAFGSALTLRWRRKR